MKNTKDNNKPIGLNEAEIELLMVLNKLKK